MLLPFYVFSLAVLAAGGAGRRFSALVEEPPQMSGPSKPPPPHSYFEERIKLWISLHFRGGQAAHSMLTIMYLIACLKG